jgi:hypothetical protein
LHAATNHRTSKTEAALISKDQRRIVVSGDERNDEGGTMNDEVKDNRFHFIVHRSYFIVPTSSFPLTLFSARCRRG